MFVLSINSNQQQINVQTPSNKQSFCKLSNVYSAMNPLPFCQSSFNGNSPPQANLTYQTQLPHHQPQTKHNIFSKHTPSKPPNPQTSQSPTSHFRLMALMREQIEICVSFYRESMNSKLKEQAKMIDELSRKLSQNQQELKAKNDLLHQFEDKGSQKQKISITKNVGKKTVDPSQLHEKIQQLENMAQQIIHFENQIQLNYQALNHKIQQVEMGSIKIIKSQLTDCHKKLQNYINTTQAKLQNLLRVPHHHPPLVKSCSDPNQSNNVILMMQELDELKRSFITYTQKQIKYDNYQVSKINSDITTLQQNVSILLAEKDILHEMINEQTRIHKTFKTETESVSMKGMKQELAKEYEEYEDVDSYEDSFQEDQEGNQDRLFQVIESEKLRVPLRVEIDQTGYLKSRENGMYIVDQNGDGFELSEGEIIRLCNKGIIQIN